MAEDSSEEQLSSRHKKERKELQAQIQIMKKSICKGDKKKKKDVTEEIVRMESDMDKRHDEESSNFKLSQLSIQESMNFPGEETVILPENDSEDDFKSSQPTQRVSKAQKRRDKKNQAEKERNQRIIEQEAVNIFGKRNVEIQTIKKVLGERDLMLYEIPSDGHCLYNAIAHQLKNIGDNPFGHQELRTKTAGYLRENMDDFLPFMSNPDSDELFSPEQYGKYCDNVAMTSAWGGAIELQVLSRILKCPIEVIQAIGAPYIIGSEFETARKVIVTYHRHMYELGAHYNSVTKFVKEEEEES